MSTTSDLRQFTPDRSNIPLSTAESSRAVSGAANDHNWNYSRKFFYGLKYIGLAGLAVGPATLCATRGFKSLLNQVSQSVKQNQFSEPVCVRLVEEMGF